ncbi:hypothetical protein HPB49_006672 [Dermacentor silvarum]|uniref:Uncharacterized protein n=1 Tax=Dermacentor silvarum TaxID=543639 RepID=A0ACB8CVP1_DERSI|nr:hypothetical protein HPB49_006672 [Dermacentor silvarum]
MGDFPAPHTARGGNPTTRKGANVRDTVQQHHLTLWNDPHIPTRIDNSVSRDRSPDLTLTEGVTREEWTRLQEALGSDHHIVQLEVLHHETPIRIGKAKLTEWTASRKESTPDNIKNTENWLEFVCGVL